MGASAFQCPLPSRGSSSDWGERSGTHWRSSDQGACKVKASRMHSKSSISPPLFAHPASAATSGCSPATIKEIPTKSPAVVRAVCTPLVFGHVVEAISRTLRIARESSLNGLRAIRNEAHMERVQTIHAFTVKEKRITLPRTPRAPLAQGSWEPSMGMGQQQNSTDGFQSPLWPRSCPKPLHCRCRRPIPGNSGLYSD